MLQKKSEYRLQYGKLNQDLRRKIWQDNITLRKSRLLSNQATHYWEYQLRDETCDCGSGDTDEDEAPLPPHRQKHKNLREQYYLQSEKPQTLYSDAREKGVQTPEWSEDEPDYRLEATNEEEMMKNMSLLTVPEAKENQNSPSSPAPPKATTTSQSRPRNATSLTRLSRTSKKLQSEPKKTHFVPYGWNEAKTKVGKKQTYNVTAPEKEVHDSAVHASRRRKAEMELHLAQEKQIKAPNTKPRERTYSNSSSQWMSEYQEQFSVKSSSRQPRPLSAPPAPRQPVTWRRS